MEIIAYKGFEGSAEVDMEAGTCRGKLLYIDDLVTYEAATPAELRVEFEAAVDDYVETCAQLGRAPKKPLKGQFNVRTTPELHLEMWRKADRLGVRLNEAVNMAFQCFVNPPVGIEHHEHHDHFITINSDDATVRNLTASASGEIAWTPLLHVSH